MQRALRALWILVLCASAQSAKGIEAVVNHAYFYRPAGTTLEVYWEVTPTSLHYQKDSTGKISTRIRSFLRVSCDTGILHSDRYVLQTTPFDVTVSEAPRIIELQRIAAPAGRIRIELQLSEEAHPESSIFLTDTFSIPAAGTTAYSTLQLLDTFYAAPALRDPFVHDGFRQIPKTLHFYDEGQRTVHTYFELAGLDKVASGDYPVVQGVWISRNPGGAAMAQVLRDTIRKALPGAAFRRSLSTALLPSGNYYLNVSLENARGQIAATASQFFQMLNRSPDGAQSAQGADTSSTTKMTAEGTYVDISSAFVSKFTVAQMRAVMKMLLPSASPVDENAIIGFMQRPDEQYMRFFIYNHFAAINKADPGKAWKEFSEGIREVNRRFGSGSTMGYETDRGRIYLRYGPPAEEVRAPSEAGAQPYEIWRYNAGGRLHAPGLFLFYSPGYAGNDMQLLHSNVPGEKQQPEWRKYLYSTGHGSGNINSRAEEAFGNGH